MHAVYSCVPGTRSLTRVVKHLGIVAVEHFPKSRVRIPSSLQVSLLLLSTFTSTLPRLCPALGFIWHTPPFPLHASLGPALCLALPSGCSSSAIRAGCLCIVSRARKPQSEADSDFTAPGIFRVPPGHAVAGELLDHRAGLLLSVWYLKNEYDPERGNVS